MEKILEVKNLKVSFRTSSGILKAVRDISFDLEKGRTLAIVGESGSGKSVTSKSILGILAGNSIIEGGEILYDGKDLLKLSEDQIHEIRGDKISMIFQDPLSSLNPIVKIGKQITEAMLLKSKTNRKQARNDFNNLLKVLQENMIAADPSNAENIKTMCKSFDDFCIEANKMEASFNQSEAAAEGLVDNFEDFRYMASKHQKQDTKNLLKEYLKRLATIKDEFFTNGYADKLNSVKTALTTEAGNYKPAKGENEDLPASLITAVENTENLLREMIAQEKPNFFRIGYYKLHNPSDNLLAYSIPDLNEKALEVLNNEFMNGFLAAEEKGVKYSYTEALKHKKDVVSELEAEIEYYKGTFEKKDALARAKKLNEQVELSIDRLETNKDSYAYTFGTSLASAIEKYFHYVEANPKEEARFAKETAKREALIAKGKTVDWKVVPKNIIDLEGCRKDIISVIERLLDRYKAFIDAGEIDYAARSIEIVDYFKDKASKAVYVVTKEMAKERAIKLMEEVDIPEPRMRYNQYPFEFSGGMRQRIVIAIALSADPEILICDEPTTALDVTIQAQILELINRLKAERNLSIIFITHDLGVVANMADDIAVMYAGKIVEYGSADDIFYNPRHPYTWALLQSMPDLDTKERLEAIPGTPPNMVYPPVGDAFADRNKYAMAIDYEMQPPAFYVSDKHWAATWLLHPDAPKIEIPKQIQERIARNKARGEQNGK